MRSDNSVLAVFRLGYSKYSRFLTALESITPVPIYRTAEKNGKSREKTTKLNEEVRRTERNFSDKQ